MDTIALDIIKTGGEVVDPLQNVIFDTVLLQEGPVLYNASTGVITFTRAGRFMVSWNVVTQAAVGTNTVAFALDASNGQQIVSGSPVKNGEVVGFGIIQVDSAPVTLRLANAVTAPIYFAVESVFTAHLVIGELLETTGNPPAEWEGSGVALNNNQPSPGNVTIVLDGGVVPFDNITVQYNAATYVSDEILILDTGTYMITWNVTAQTDNGINNSLIFLEDTVGNVYGKSGTDALALSPITGTTLVQVTSVPFTLSLINRSGTGLVIDSIYNGPLPTSTYFAGSLTVAKVADLYFS